jgi:hypothetical protein
MLFVPPIFDLDEELSCDDGLWSRSQLLEMDARFCEALERAFQAGFESRAAAVATVRIGPNGSRRLAEEAAIQAGWNWFVDAKFDVPAAAVVARVRAQCPNIESARIRAAFEWRFKRTRERRSTPTSAAS